MAAALICIAILAAAGPRPDRKDIPYLLHASVLVRTEEQKGVVQNIAESAKYIVPGETSAARTPLALPIFLIDAAELKPDKLRLIRLTAANGHREAVTRGAPADGQPLLLTVTSLGDGLYRVEAVNEIENGEYALNAQGSDRFFCFTVF